ncbi:MAG: hypothetical protein MSIBF_01785 [Candidatus Altiarchaeales archaeon IMC4]|nr:MAG: hypothetical protein MSIBF_01785 [Candidatus Altiarchaeales archaeon IMC4]
MVTSVVSQRISEFEETRKKGDAYWFRELCFCLLTANFTAQGAINICQKEKETGAFTACSFEELCGFLKKHKHRFPNARAKYICEARRFCADIKGIVTGFHDEREARLWLVKNIKGLGCKEASHFLRNVGYKNVAILDRHILRVLHESGFIAEVPDTMNKKCYLEIENIMQGIAHDTGLSLAELDLFMWYMKTGRVLK